MEIKKADSKGRVSGFTPGSYYFLDRENGVYYEIVESNREHVKALANATDEEIDRFGGLK